MPRPPRSTPVRFLAFRKVIGAPLPFVYRWCTDYRDDDDRLTHDIYHFRARVILRERRRVVRVVTVPGKDRNRCTDVEVITLLPPDAWTLRKMSVTNDEVGLYHLTSLGPDRTEIEMRFRETWKSVRPPDRMRYRALYIRVWDRYASRIEAAYRRARPDRGRA